MATDLLPGERILWEGRRLRHPLFRPADVYLVPFSLVWFGLVGGSVLSAVLNGAKISSVVCVVPFVLLGLYLFVGRFVVRAVASRRTRYTLTNGRILVYSGWSGRRLTTAYLGSLPPPIITERPDGSGNLAFGSFPGVFDTFARRRRVNPWSSEPSGTPILREVPEVRRVRDFVAYAQAQIGGHHYG